MEAFIVGILDIIIAAICFARFFCIIVDSKTPEIIINIKVWILISIGTFLAFFLVPLLLGGHYSSNLVFRSGYTFFWIPLVGIPFVVACIKIVAFFYKRNIEKKATIIKDQALAEIEKIKLVSKEINGHIEKYNQVCKTVALLGVFDENNLFHEYKFKKTLFFQNLMNGKQMSTIDIKSQEKQDIAHLISNFRIRTDSLPLIGSKINSMTNDDLIKTWRSIGRKPNKFIKKVEKLIK